LRLPTHVARANQVHPSAKFRRKLEKAAAEIAATEKRLTAAEKTYFTELDFLERET
jgi:hypothetical protein